MRTPGIVHQVRTAVFGPKAESPVALHSFPGSQDAGMYTRSELSSIWDSILITAASRNALKEFSQKLNVFLNNNKNPDCFPYYAPHRLLCRQHDLTWLHQRSVNGYIWTSRIIS